MPWQQLSAPALFTPKVGGCEESPTAGGGGGALARQPARALPTGLHTFSNRGAHLAVDLGSPSESD